MPNCAREAEIGHDSLEMAVFLTCQVTYIVVLRIKHIICEVFAIDTSFRLFWIGFPVCFEGDRVKFSASDSQKVALIRFRFSVVELDWKSRRIFFGNMFLALRREERYVYSLIYRRKRLLVEDS